MRAEYDFARMKGRRNPYARRLKRSVTMRLDEATIAYFKELAVDTGVAYQSLINLYLRDCVRHRRRPAQSWVSDDDHPAASDPRFAARIAQARASVRAGKAIPREDVQAGVESASAGFRVSDQPATRSPRRRSRT